LRFLTTAAAAGAIVCASFSSRNEPTRAPLDEAARSYVRLALALGERDADSLDGYHGPATWQAEVRAERPSLSQTRAKAITLARSLEVIAPDDRIDEQAPRRAFLIRQLRAIVSRIEVLQGARPPFDDEARLLFGIEANGAARDQPARIRAELDRMLPGRGDPAARYAAFDRRFQVPADRVAAVFERAVAGCRAVTREHVALPAAERVTIEYARGLPWSAFTRY